MGDIKIKRKTDLKLVRNFSSINFDIVSFVDYNINILSVSNLLGLLRQLLGAPRKKQWNWGNGVSLLWPTRNAWTTQKLFWVYRAAGKNINADIMVLCTNDHESLASLCQLSK